MSPDNGMMMMTQKVSPDYVRMMTQGGESGLRDDEDPGGESELREDDDPGGESRFHDVDDPRE